MNYVDVLLLLPIAYGLIRGLIKGLIHELASIVAILLGIYFAYTYSDQFSEWLTKYWETSENNIYIASYIILFMIVSLAVFAIAFILTKMLKMMALGMVNRVLGGIFGMAKSLLLLSLFLFFTQTWFKQLKKESKELRHSVVYEKLMEVSLFIGGFSTDYEIERKSPFDFIPPSIKDSLDAREILPL